ncbi:MAG: glycosyltransferase [Deltaproteobacteria bacterium]|nr:glycosyltransferase [Deltaproteobacteria bacterium]
MDKLQNQDNKPSVQHIENIAVIVPRYGRDVGGGAETLIKSLVDNLKLETHAPRIEVWTTCAKDHRTWANFHQPGVIEIDGITVRRFLVDERNLDIFIRHELDLAGGKVLSPTEQMEWLENSVNSKSLYQHILEHGQEFSALLFGPYLFATSFWGALIHPQRSVLLPCLHRERYAYLQCFRFLFEKVRGLIFNSAPEMVLANEIYQLPCFSEKSAVVGMSFDERFDLPQAKSWADLKATFPGIEKPYLIYSGRKEEGKKLDLLIEYFARYRAKCEQCKTSLVLIGAGEISFLKELPPHVYDLGFVSEEDKQALMEHASLLCQPSLNESFSIVIMEAWLRNTAVLVHSLCAVTKDHVLRSEGGFHFGCFEEFENIISQLEQNESLCREMGKKGQAYVKSEYCWDAVNQRLSEAWKKFGLI